MFNGKLTPDRRLEIWRQVRTRLRESEADMTAVAEVFGGIPVQTRCVDYYTPESWPDAFEIVYNGWLCQSGITIVLVSTMNYLGLIKTPEVALPVISNHVTGTEGLVLEYDDQCYNCLSGHGVSKIWTQQNSTEFIRHVIASDKFLH